MNKPRHFFLPFFEKKQITKETFTFSFELENQRDFVFQPGQFIRMQLVLNGEDPRSNRRYFTISSPPSNGAKLSITTRITDTPSLFKQKLISLEKGDEVSFWGPSGAFTMPSDESVPLVFISGGIGITPFHSMLSFLSYTKSFRAITLLASYREVEEIAFNQELASIRREYKNLEIVYTITHQNSSWNGETGRITKKMIEQHVDDVGEKLYYVSGPIPFVKAIVGEVKSLGVVDEWIKQDSFPGY